MHNSLQPKLILVAILAAYATPQMAMAENRAEAIELGKIEVVGTTPLGGLECQLSRCRQMYKQLKLKIFRINMA